MNYGLLINWRHLNEYAERVFKGHIFYSRVERLLVQNDVDNRVISFKENVVPIFSKMEVRLTDHRRHGSKEKG